MGFRLAREAAPDRRTTPGTSRRERSSPLFGRTFM